MFLNNRTTGASCKNIVDIVANSIQLYDPNGSGHYTNIDDIFVKQSQVIPATQNASGVFDFPPESINDYNVSGLQSMIDYINTHTRTKPSYSYEDNSSIIIKKKINASKKQFVYEDNQTLNKINKTINKINKQFVFDDNSTYTMKKNLNKTTKQLFYDDTILYNRVNNTTNNNNYKH